MSSDRIPKIASRQDLRPSAPDEVKLAHLRVSPDGERLAFHADDGVDAGIMVADISAGGDVDQPRSVVLLGPAAVDELAWSPSGEHLAYVTGNGLPTGAERWVGWAPTTTGEGELGRVPGAAFCWGVAKPSLTVANLVQQALVHVDLATGTTIVLGELFDDGELHYPPHIAIPSDSRHIAYSRRSSFRDLSEVWLVKRVKDESNTTGLSNDLLTQIPGADIAVKLVWSPKGKSVALFIPHATIEQTAIIVVHKLQGDGEVLHHHDQLDAPFCPAWSPDGRWMAFFCCMTGQQQLSLLDVRDRTVYPLTADIEPGPLHYVAQNKLAIGSGPHKGDESGAAALLTLADV